MMATNSHRFAAWFIASAFSCALLSLACSSALNQTGVAVSPRRSKALNRLRREGCHDGTYEHGGRSCCKCGAGQYLLEDCSATQDDRKCMGCPRGTYSDHPNSQKSCLPCKSCDHPNANLKELEPCTPAKNRKCGCKEGHYCSTGPGTCFVCQPCTECGSEGVKVACTNTNNTICNDKTEGRNTGIIVAALVSVLVIMITGFLCYRLKFRRKGPDPLALPQERQPLADLEPHVPDIAEVLGWKEMKKIALRSLIPKTTIEACELDHPKDSQEQTIQLLQKWVEKQGTGASEKLIQRLQDSGKMKKAEDVMKILRKGNAATSNTRV